MTAAFATTNKAPEKWNDWVSKHQKELKEPFSKYLAKDIVRLKKDERTMVTKDGKDSVVFRPESFIAPMAYITWDGDHTLKLKMKDKVRALELKDGSLEQTKIEENIAIDGFKNKPDGRFVLFIYDSKQKDLEPLRKFDTFDYNPKYKVTAEFHKASTIKDVTIAATRGEPKKWKNFGYLTFQLDGKEQKLNVSQSEDNKKELFLMFKDSSNGDHTYKGGRFLEHELAGTIDQLKTGDNIELDFNFAFNPLCAKSHAFYCPIPLDSLDIAVLAGEKKVTDKVH